MKSNLTGPGLFPEVPLRALALLDAVVFPAMGLYWITTWPQRGGLFGAVVGALLVWWAIKRGSRALFAFDDYRWIARHLIKLAALGYLFLGLHWLLSDHQDTQTAKPVQHADQTISAKGK